MIPVVSHIVRGCSVEQLDELMSALPHFQRAEESTVIVDLDDLSIAKQSELKKIAKLNKLPERGGYIIFSQ